MKTFQFFTKTALIVQIFSLIFVFSGEAKAATGTQFDYIPAKIEIRLRVLDEGKRYVQNVSVKLDQLSNCEWGQGVVTNDLEHPSVVKITYQKNIAVQDLSQQFTCLSPLKLQVINFKDPDFPSGVVTLPPIMAQQEYNNLSNAIQGATMNIYNEWRSNQTERERNRNGYNASFLNLYVDADMKADYQNKFLTVFLGTPSFSVGSFLKKDAETYKWTVANTFNNVDFLLKGRWLYDGETIGVRPLPATTTTTPTVSTGEENTDEEFAAKLWEAQLKKYTITKERFDPFSNQDKVAFYGIATGFDGTLITNSEVKITNLDGTVVQKTTTDDRGIYFFFPEGLQTNSKYNVFVSERATGKTFMFNEEEYPFYTESGKTVVYGGKSEQINISVGPFIIKNTETPVQEVKVFSMGIFLILAVCFVVVGFILYKFYLSNKAERETKEDNY